MNKDEALDLALEALENLFGIPAQWTGEGGGDVAVWRLGGSHRAQAAITAIKQARALDKKAENARELGLDYEPAPKQRWAVFCRFCNKEWSVSYKHPGKSVCVDCDNALPAQPAPVQDSTCRETLRAQGKAYPRTCRKCGLGPCIGAPKQPPAAQRQWVGLTDEDIIKCTPTWGGTVEDVARAIEAKLKEKNT